MSKTLGPSGGLGPHPSVVDTKSLIVEEMEKEQADKMNKRAFSFLSGEQIRWMAKRKSSASFAAKPFVPPSRVLQLRSIFKGLDIDGSGEISLQELKDAVRYVAKAPSAGPPLIKDPDSITALFESMDIDGNGVVDFEEFVLGMTSPTTDGGPSVKDIAALQNAFYDFANQHRRTLIIDKLKDDSVPVAERYDEFRKLYAIKFLKEDDSGALTLEEKIRNAEKEAAVEKGEMAAASKVLRRLEVMRARGASIAFHEKMRLKYPLTDGPYPRALRGYIGSTVPMLANKGAGVYRSRKQLQATGTSKTLEELRRSQLEDDIRASQPDLLAARLAKFHLPPEPTYMPPLAVSRSTSHLAAMAGKEAAKMRSGVVDSRSELMAAPLSMRSSIIKRVNDSKIEHEAAAEKRHHHHHHHHHNNHHHHHHHHNHHSHHHGEN